MKNKYSNFIPLVFIILLISTVAYFDYEKDCEYDRSCFDLEFQSCNKAKYLFEDRGNLFEYTILGDKGSNCEIKIMILETSEESDFETRELFVGKSMTCLVPNSSESYTAVDTPYDLCTGPLKEAMYELIIQKMYSVLAQNLGDLIYQLQE